MANVPSYGHTHIFLCLVFFAVPALFVPFVHWSLRWLMFDLYKDKGYKILPTGYSNFKGSQHLYSVSLSKAVYAVHNVNTPTPPCLHVNLWYNHIARPCQSIDSHGSTTVGRVCLCPLASCNWMTKLTVTKRGWLQTPRFQKMQLDIGGRLTLQFTHLAGMAIIFTELYVGKKIAAAAAIAHEWNQKNRPKGPILIQICFFSSELLGSDRQKAMHCAWVQVGWLGTTKTTVSVMH